MMETLVIQPDKNSMKQVEEFVDAVCYNNHLDNYLATISVPVIKVVQDTLQSSHNSASNGPVTVSTEYCHEGICFIVHSYQNCFSQFSSSFPLQSSLNSFSDSIQVVKLLVDEFEILDNGSTLRMVFFVRGIDAKEASRRKEVLSLFYQPAMVESN